MRDWRATMFDMVFGLGMVLSLGCGGGPRMDPIVGNPETALGRLVIAPPAAVLAVGATQQFTTSPMSLTDAPVTDADSVRYYLPTAPDSARIGLDATTGVVTARAVTTTTALVNAFAFRGREVVGEQALVQVTATAISGLTLSIQPSGSDSARLAFNSAKTITPVLRNPATGQSVANPALRYTVRPEDRLAVRVYAPTITTPAPLSFVVQSSRSLLALGATQINPSVAEGSAWIYGAVNVYGTLLRDSVRYTFTYPFSASITAAKSVVVLVNASTNSPAVSSVICQAPATITFTGRYTSTTTNAPVTDTLTRIAFTFNNPAAALAAIPPSTVGGASGNTAPLIAVQTQSTIRRFVTPGTYTWTATAVSGAPSLIGQSVTGTIEIR